MSTIYKRQRTPKGQSKMDNPEKLTTQGTQGSRRRTTKQKHIQIHIVQRFESQIHENKSLQVQENQTTKENSQNWQMLNTMIRVITKLPNSEQSYKGKVKTHKYINRQNQSTTGGRKTSLIYDNNYIVQVSWLVDGV